EEVKRLFPQHSEVDRLIQSSQQAVAEGKDKSGLSNWLLIGGGIAFILFIFGLLLIGLIIFLIMRRRGKSKAAPGVLPASAAPAGRVSMPPTPARPAYSPSPAPSFPAPAAPKPATPAPQAAHVSPIDNRTVDLGATIAIQPDGDTSDIHYGSI